MEPFTYNRDGLQDLLNEAMILNGLVNREQEKSLALLLLLLLLLSLLRVDHTLFRMTAYVGTRFVKQKPEQRLQSYFGRRYPNLDFNCGRPS
jgi:hypothetical protein